MFATTFKKIALATVIVAVTASTSMAAQWAWVTKDTNIRFKPNTSSMIVNAVEAGDKVKVVDSHGNWVKLALPGKDGWIRDNRLTTKPKWHDANWGWGGGYGNNYGPSFGSSFCVAGKNAQFCLGASY